MPRAQPLCLNRRVHAKRYFSRCNLPPRLMARTFPKLPDELQPSRTKISPSKSPSGSEFQSSIIICDRSVVTSFRVENLSRDFRDHLFFFFLNRETNDRSYGSNEKFLCVIFKRRYDPKFLTRNCSLSFFFFFGEEIRKLADRWDKYIESGDRGFSKMHVYTWHVKRVSRNFRIRVLNTRVLPHGTWTVY